MVDSKAKNLEDLLGDFEDEEDDGFDDKPDEEEKPKVEVKP